MLVDEASGPAAGSGQLDREGVDGDVTPCEVLLDCGTERDGGQRAWLHIGLGATRCDIDVEDAPGGAEVDHDGRRAERLVDLLHLAARRGREQPREGGSVTLDREVDVGARVDVEDCVTHGAADDVHAVEGQLRLAHAREQRLDARGTVEDRCRVRLGHSPTAMHSISTLAPAGSAATWKVERAGGVVGK